MPPLEHPNPGIISAHGYLKPQPTYSHDTALEAWLVRLRTDPTATRALAQRRQAARDAHR